LQRERKRGVDVGGELPDPLLRRGLVAKTKSFAPTTLRAE
jgi:hypothetical protein